MPMRAQISLIMGHIEPEGPELFALEFGKTAESDFVYTLASTNIDQSAPNLVKMYVTIRFQMSLIMDLIGSELSELSTLELENLPYLTFFYTLVSANIDPISTKVGHSIYAHIVSNEFDYGTNQTRTSGVICPWIWKTLLNLTLFTL